MRDHTTGGLEHGTPTAAETERLAHLARRLSDTAGGIRVIDYDQAERDAIRLAERLIACCGETWVHEARFTAIPRGGLIVLGMLSYALDLHADQLTVPTGWGGPLCLVDDCALTGARLGQALESAEGEPIIFAHLYSHPALRRAIRRRSPVGRCIAARDLTDGARRSAQNPESYEAWRRRWRERLGQERFWLGRPDLVCFPWSEADQLFFNPVTERVEDGWRFASPDRVLKNRTRLGMPPRSSARPTAWRVPDAVLYGIFDGVVWLLDITDGSAAEIRSLDGVGADMWRAVAAYGELSTAAEVLGERYAVVSTILRADLEGFATRLANVGLLERIEST